MLNNGKEKNLGCIMSIYNIEFTTDKEDRLNIIIFADNITEAYLSFVEKFPIEYIITDITGVKIYDTQR